jgi:hypothetical protein
VSDSPLPRPEHLRDVPSSRGEWIKQRPFALAALALGVISFIVVAISQQQFWSTPDWRISVPGVAVTAITALVSLVRREPGAWVWAIGVGLAGAALVLGWFMMLAIVVGATLVLMWIVSNVM